MPEALHKCFVVALMLGSCATPAVADNLTVGEIRVRLFFNDTATLSEPVSEHQSLKDLPNGSAKGELPTDALTRRGPSTETLIDVVVRGAPNGYFQGRRVEVDVTDSKGATVEHLSARVGPLNESGVYFASFLLRDTGCEALIVTARLNVSKQQVTRRLDFECSE